MVNVKDIEYIECPFCNNDRDAVSHYKCWNENGWDGNRCDKCGVVYISPRPTKAYMKELYESGENSGMCEHDHFTYHYSEYLFNKWLIKLIRKYHPKAYVRYLLEIGVGGGMFYRQTEMNDNIIGKIISYGVEINDNQRNRLHDEFGLTVYPDIDKIEYGMVFDIIFHKNVLSHLHDPKEVFEKCHDCLNDNGIMVFVTGNGGNISLRWIQRLNKLGYPEHLFMYSNKAIYTLAEQTGFEIIYHKTFPKLLDIIRFFNPFSKGSRGEMRSIEKTDFNFTLKEKTRGFFSYIINYWISRVFSKKLPSNVVLVLRKT